MGPGGTARLAWLLLLAAAAATGHAGVQPLSRIAIHRVRVTLDASAAVRASPVLLGPQVCLYVLDLDVFLRMMCCLGMLGLCVLACSAAHRLRSIWVLRTASKDERVHANHS
jgi:hypothetical protein